MNQNSRFPENYDYSDISQDDLKILQEAEQRINQNKKQNIVLIAFEKNDMM